MRPEEEWAEATAQDFERRRKMARIEPGRGHRTKLEHSTGGHPADWCILAIIVLLILAGLL